MAKYDYVRLVQDLKDATTAARSFTAAALAEHEKRGSGMFDGGTCCMDAAVLVLPGARESDFEGVLRSAGCNGFQWSAGRFTVSPPSGYQGSPRTAEARFMAEFLEGRGWTTTMYYQMD